ncbi:uncharacterized protein EV420DRAFT_1633843 [Desarmillaria tabescens]|uniref:Uncharacterized protein n=1 Tax=Armillaria tabescens TaxID=1929756 RepID=A0AA39NPJ2_ARMTA|nr:uncharacterized protein EV420DRAFT_1633843 [Desarmillaria tabescens]KAK0469428.1 hypothetical protein EV420DRAFT_1633843 [Desarmillaria tabescens]
MDDLAPELKDRIVWFASSNHADVSALSLINHSFLHPSRRHGHRTLRIKDSVIPLGPYDIYTPGRQAYLAKCNRRTPRSLARALQEDFPQVGEYVHRIIFDTTYFQTADVLAMYDLIDELPRLSEVVLENTDLSFFTTSLCTLLSAVDGISTLVLRSCCVDTKSLNILMNSALIILLAECILTYHDLALDLRVLGLSCCNEYNIVMADLKPETLGAISKLQSLTIGARTVGWEGEALAYEWFGGLQFQTLRFLTLHVHHEVDADVVEILLLNCGCITELAVQLSTFQTLRHSTGRHKLNLSRLINLTSLAVTVEGQDAFNFFLHSLGTLPRPSLLAVDLVLVYSPKDWPKPMSESAKSMDNTLCKLIDSGRFERMIVGFCRNHSGRHVETLARDFINNGLRELKAKVGGRLLTEQNHMHALVRFSVDSEGHLWRMEDNMHLCTDNAISRLTHLYLETPSFPFECEATKLDWLKRITFPELQVLQISISYDFWLDDVQLLLERAFEVNHLILNVCPYHCIENRCAEHASDHSRCLLSLANLGRLQSLSIITGIRALKMVERTLGTLSKVPLWMLSLEFAYFTKRWSQGWVEELRGVDEAIISAIDLERLDCMKVFSHMHDGSEESFLCAPSVMATQIHPIHFLVAVALWVIPFDLLLQAAVIAWIVPYIINDPIFAVLTTVFLTLALIRVCIAAPLLAGLLVALLSLKLASVLVVTLLALTDPSFDDDNILMTGPDYETDLNLIIATLAALTILALTIVWSLLTAGYHGK